MRPIPPHTVRKTAISGPVGTSQVVGAGQDYDRSRAVFVVGNGRWRRIAVNHWRRAI